MRAGKFRITADSFGVIAKLAACALAVIVICHPAVASAQTWEQTNGPYGGDVQALAIDVNGDIFAGTFTGGVFRSTDNGNNWHETGLRNICVNALAISGSGDVLAGTESAGVFRSTDDGNSWTQINTGLTGGSVSALLIDGAGRLFAGTDSGVFLYTDDNGIWILAGLQDIDTRALCINDEGYIFAGTGGNGIFRSTDNGQSWTQIFNGLTNGIVYSLTTNVNGNLFAGTAVDGVFRSTDNGENWTQLSTEIAGFPIYSMAISTDGVIFAGGHSGWVNIDPGAIFRSTDNGEHWIETTTGLPNTHVKALAINSGGDIFVGILWGGGVYRSTNNGDNWSQVNAGLRNAGIHALIANSSGDLFAGTTYGGVHRSTDDGENWVTTLANKDISDLAVNGSDVLFAGAWESEGAFRSTDNGETWQNIGYSLFGRPVWTLAVKLDGNPLAGSIDGVYSYNEHYGFWNWDLIGLDESTIWGIYSLAVNCGGDIFAGCGTPDGARIFRTTDNGANWVQGDYAGSGQSIVLDLAVGDNGYIFAGTSKDGVLRSTDNGQTWTQINSGLTDEAVNSFAIDGEGGIYAGTGTGVFHSTDNGNNWFQVGTGLAGAGTIAIGAGGQLFAGMGSGVYRLNNGLPDYAIFINDHFSEGPDPAWTQTEGTCTWQVTDGVLGASLTGDQASCVLSAGDNSWSNYILEADVRGNDGVDKIVRFRQADSETRYFVNLRSDYLGQDEIFLGRQKDGIETIFQTVSYPSQNGTWYHLKIACVDEHISVYVDDNLVISYDDCDSRIYTGGIGLVCFTGSVGVCDISFDNVVVTDPFPQVAFDSDPIYNVGDNITLSGVITNGTGEPYQPGGDCSVDNPLDGQSEPLTVNADGTFSCQLTGAAQNTGTYVADIAITTGYGTARSYFAFAVNNPAIAPPYEQNSEDERPASYKTDLKVDLGSSGDLPSQPTQNVSAKPSFWHQYWSTIGNSVVDGFVEPTKDLFRQDVSFVEGGWKRTTNSFTGRIAVGVFNAGVEKTVTSGPDIGSTAAMGGALYVLGTGLFANTFTEAFHQLVDISSNQTDPILTPEEAARTHLLVDDMSMVLSVLRMNPNGDGIIDAAHTTLDAGLLVPKYIDVVDKHLNLNNKGKSGAENFEDLSFIVVDSANEIMVIGVEPKLDNVCTVQSFSPIRLSVTDPRGRVVDWDASEVPGSRYYRMDTDQDGDSSTLVIVPLDTVGQVSVTVVPDAGAQPDDSFTVLMDNTYYQEPISLAENMPISDIPAEPLTAETFENLPPSSPQIITADDAIFSAPPCLLEWHPGIDPNPGHIVSYQIVVAREPDYSDSVSIPVGTDTSFSFDGSLPGLSKELADTLLFHWKVIASDDWGAAAETAFRSFSVQYLCGDASGDQAINIADAVYLINYIFKSGPAPGPLQAGDANCDGTVNIGDAVHLINYIFKGGPEPCCP